MIRPFFLAMVFCLMPQLCAQDDLDLTYWGRVDFNLHQDTYDLKPFFDFATHLTGEGESKLNFNPRDTRFGFSVHSDKGSWRFGMVAEADFYGDNSSSNLTPRLRLGYVSARNDNGLSLRMGQDWIPLATQMPATLDFGVLSWGGNIWWRVPQITLRKKLGDVTLMAGVMKHRISNNQEAAEKNPWFMSRVAWKKGRTLVALGGAYRDVDVVGLEEDRLSRDVLFSGNAHLIALEWSLEPWAGTKIVGEAWSGAGLGREFVRYGLDYNLETEEIIGGTGGFMSVSQKLKGRYQLNLGGGLDSPERDDVLNDSGVTAVLIPFQRNQSSFINLKRQISPRFGAGTEVMHFRTKLRTGNSLTGLRFSIGAWYRFKSKF